MATVTMLVLACALLLVVYAYVLYPALLRLLGRNRRRAAASAPAEWPLVSISLPVYNEEAQIESVLEALLAIDYPADRRQILVISDGSTDRTEEIVAGWAARGIELLRMPGRSGKTASENAGARLLRGDIVINTDASVRIHPAGVKELVRQFADTTVGVASGRDVSVSRATADGNVGESGYVGYEMTVRSLETTVHGIVGASGCFYAIRAPLHRAPLPEGLSRDFAAPLTACEHGYRSVSVDDALCYVPRTTSLQREYRRKVRTMTRGIQTLAHKRHLLNPFRYGVFAWMLLSHKICRWSLPWALALSGLAVFVVSLGEPWWWLYAGAIALLGVAIAFAWLVDQRVRLPRLISMPVFAALANIAALHATVRALRGVRNATWEPTRREPTIAADGAA
jgi:cellulose synthase/poly-beta-1,6-N-acetylglucosamine synthase-like glycosyltransferase